MIFMAFRRDELLWDFAMLDTRGMVHSLSYSHKQRIGRHIRGPSNQADRHHKGRKRRLGVKIDFFVTGLGQYF